MQDFVAPVERIETSASQLNQMLDNLVDECVDARKRNGKNHISNFLLSPLKIIKERSMQFDVECPACRQKFAVCPDSFSALFENSTAFAYCPLLNCRAGLFLDIWRESGEIKSITLEAQVDA